MRARSPASRQASMQTSIISCASIFPHDCARPLTHSSCAGGVSSNRRTIGIIADSLFTEAREACRATTQATIALSVKMLRSDPAAFPFARRRLPRPVNWSGVAAVPMHLGPPRGRCHGPASRPGVGHRLRSGQPCGSDGIPRLPLRSARQRLPRESPASKQLPEPCTGSHIAARLARRRLPRTSARFPSHGLPLRIPIPPWRTDPPRSGKPTPFRPLLPASRDARRVRKSPDGGGDKQGMLPWTGMSRRAPVPYCRCASTSRLPSLERMSSLLGCTTAAGQIRSACRNDR
jgi:hypothetical protein